MGKKGGKRGPKSGANVYGSDIRKKFKGEETFNEWEYNHPTFEAYYRLQFEDTYFKEDASEFEKFWSTMKEKLPVVFRVNKLVPNYQVFLNSIKKENLIQDFIEAKRKQLAEAKLLKESAATTEAIEVEKPQEPKQSSKEHENKEHKEEEEVEGGEGDAVENKFKIERFEFSEEELSNLKIKPIAFYPDELVWQVNCNRTQLKKSQLLKEFHRFIQRATDSGLVSRQELVSMLPPLFLDVDANDTVFDMCAAPGSKTAQLLEIMMGKGGIGTKGAVIANDVDQQRAYLLTHQVCRINPSGLVVINHPAQFFPRLPDQDSEDKKFCFDKVQADVPCSGDGATRKIPTQWQNWSTKDGQVLHPLQLAILQRALTLCKVGGYVIYSTCSLNPIEDESVVTEAFRRASAGSIELVDIHDQLPTLKGRRGLSAWKVFSLLKRTSNDQTTLDLLKKYDSIEDVIPGDRDGHFLRSSMFPGTEEFMRDTVKIQNSMRILPHDQDTGGFYLALFKKTAPIVWDRTGHEKPQKLPSTSMQVEKPLAEQEPVVVADPVDDDDLPDASEIPKEAEKLQNLDQAGNENDAGTTDAATGVKVGKPNSYIGNVKECFVPISDDDWKNVQENYGFEGIEQTLFVNSVIGKQKVIRLITPAARRFTGCDQKGLINIVNMGTKALEKSKEGNVEIQCRFRICQDSVNLLGPLMTKRKLTVSEKDFVFFILNKNAKYAEIPNEELRAAISALGQGTVVLYCASFDDYIVCQNFQTSVNIMTNREITESFKIRYIEHSA